MGATWSKALRDLSQRRLRGFLTVLGIVIGVAGIVAIISTSQSLADAQVRAYAQASQADLTVRTSDAPDELERQLLKIPNVAQAELRATYYTKWKVGGQWKDLYFIAFPDYQNMRLDTIELLKGSFPQKGSAVLEKSSLQVNPVSTGDAILYRAYSQERLREKTLTVSGLASTPVYGSASLFNRSIVYASLEDVRSMLGIEGNNEVKLKLVDMRQKDDTKERVREVMARRNLPVINMEERDPYNYPGKRELDSLLLLMLLFSALGLVISSFLVANTLAAIMGEQMGEIGIMKALGASRWQVVRIYILEALIYGLAGTLLGVGLGWAGGWVLIGYLAQLMNLEVWFALVPLAIVAGVVIGIFVTLAAALFPALVGTGLSVREALENYGISPTYGRGWLDRALLYLRGIPPSVALSIRNLARRKGRTAATVLVVALASASLLAAWTTDASVLGTIDKLYNVYDASAFIWFEQKVGKDFEGAIRTFPEVEAVEAWSLASGVVKGVKAQIKGIPWDSRLYLKSLRDGSWYGPGEQHSAVVSTDLARRADIRVGDVVEIDLGDRSDRFKVVGTVFDSSSPLGAETTGNLFLSPDMVPYDRRGRATLFAVKIADPTGGHIDEVLGKMERKFREWGPGTYSIEVDKQSSRRQVNILRAMVYGMVLIVGVIGGIGILNTQTLNVLERRREIGVMRALGAGDGNLVQVFLAEGLFLGALGGALGLAMGYPLAHLFVGLLSNYLFELEVSLPSWGPAALVAYALALAAASSLAPSWGAARFSASQALRYE